MIPLLKDWNKEKNNKGDKEKKIKQIAAPEVLNMNYLN